MNLLRSHLARPGTRTAGFVVFFVLCVCAFFMLVETDDAAAYPDSSPRWTCPADPCCWTCPADPRRWTCPVDPPRWTSPV